MTIWKFPLFPGVTAVEMPAGARLLAVGVQPPAEHRHGEPTDAHMLHETAAELVSERDEANILADRALDESLAVCRAIGIDTSKDYDLVAAATRLRAECDEAVAALANERGEVERLRAALAAAHREIAEDDEGYAGVDE